MTSTTTSIRTIVIALAVLALAVPAASAMPPRDHEGVQTSSLAGTTSSTYQDLRNADNTGPRYVAPLHRSAPVAAVDPKPVVATGGGTSPFVFIVPAIVLVAMLGAGVVYTRTVRPARGSVA
jgi:hypothetical protein